MLTALEGLVGAPGAKTPTVASVSNPNSLNAPRLFCASSRCASPFVVDPLGPLCQAQDPRAHCPGHWGCHLGSHPSSRWVSGSGLALFPKESDRGRAENSGSTGQGSRGVEGGRWGVGHRTPQPFQLGGWPRAGSSLQRAWLKASGHRALSHLCRNSFPGLVRGWAWPLLYVQL